MVILFITLVFAVVFIFAAVFNILSAIRDNEKLLHDRVDNLREVLIGRGALVGGYLGKIISDIEANRKEIKNSKDYTQFSTSELEKHLGIKYQKKIEIINGVEKDLSKYVSVRRGRY